MDKQKFNVGDSVEIVYTDATLYEVKATVGSKSIIKRVGDEDSYLLDDGWFYPSNKLKLIKPAKVTKEHFPYFNPAVKDPKELTQSELQFLTKLLSEKLSELESRKIAQKAVINGLWEKSNKEDECGYYNFDNLNRYKDSNRKVKAEYKKLSVIQAKLKKQAGK